MTHWLFLIGRFVFRLIVSALLWSLWFAFILGVFGFIASSIVDKDPYLWLAAAVVGAFVGGLYGIGEGIKSFFGVTDDSEISGKEVAQEVGKNVLGGLIPGLTYLILLCDVVGWSRRARPARDAVKRSLLEAIVWSIFAFGMIFFAYGIILALGRGDFSIGYALLFVLAAAAFGAIRGAFTTAKLVNRESGIDREESNPWA